MLFHSPLHRAVQAHVKSKIKAAESDYRTKLASHKQTYKTDVSRAKEALKTNRVLALEESIQSVIKSLI